MSTGTASSQPLPPPVTGSTTRPAERERYIERQLRKTRRQVRGVELASRLMLLAAAAVAFFIIAAVFDHWLVPGGLSIYGRLAFLAAFLIGAGWFAARELAPLFVYRINPLFAAQTIERSKPTLKNTLINFLMLRSSRTGVPDVVLSAVEEQAAANLQRTPLEHVVDRSRLIHIGYLLLAMVSAFCLYYLASPKSPLQTVGRVVLPWADLVPPSRVELDEIQPGTTTVFRGERVAVSAMVRGSADDEAVTLYFSTTDRQNVDHPVRMYVSNDSHGRHTAMLPPGSATNPSSSIGDGLQQDIEYRIEAGDAVSRTYRLTVIQAPNIVVEKLDYAFPEYTKLKAETVEKTGDIKGVEGTQVTIHAAANQPIASAYLDLGGDGRHKQPMKASGQKATTTITLALNEARTSPLYSHYLVRFVTDRGHENPEPIRYRIDVTPDPAPELKMLRPEKVETAVQLDAPLPFEVEASDGLYGLADVRIVAQTGGEPAFRRNRTIHRDDKSAARVVYKHSEQLGLITLGEGKKLKPGDVIEYWAEAVDNKTPQPNVTKTDVRKLVIIEPAKRPDASQQPQNNQQEQQPNEQPQDGDRRDQNQQQKQRGENNRGQNDQARDNQDQRQPNDQQNQQGDGNDKGGGSNDKGGDSNRGQNDAKNKSQDKTGSGNQQPDQKKKPAMNDAGETGDKNDQQRGKSGDQTGNGKQRESGNEKDRNQEKGQKGESRRRDERNDANSEAQQGDLGDDVNKEGPSQKQDDRPVDKSDDGEAFNRILKHAQEKDGKTPEQTEQNNSQERTNDGQDGQEKKPTDSAESKRDNGQAGAKQNQPDEKGNAGPKKSETDGSQAGSKKQQQKEDDDNADQNKEAGSPGAEQKGKTKSDNEKEGKSGEAQSDQSKQEKQGSDGSSSATPAPQEKARPKNGERPADKSAANKSEEQKGKSPAHGKNESNTKGENSGDRTGRGKEGGGQNDNRAGRGAAGSSDAADEGGKAAQEKGSGETGEKAGDDKTADGKTGESGSEKGKGSKSNSGAGDKQQKVGDQGAEPTPQPDAKDGNRDAKTKQQETEASKGSPANDEKSNQPSDAKNGEKGEPGRGTPSDKQAKAPQSPEGNGAPTGGGGKASGELPPPPDVPRVEPTDDKANLEYSKRATDLALEHLRHQLKDGQPDQDLLDRLGWSKDDLQKMLARWEKMQREAQQPGPQAQKAKERIQDALLSLGLKNPRARRAASSAADDAARGLRDAARIAPPPEYQDEFGAFQRSISRAEK